MKKLKLKLIAITVATMTTATLPSVSASAAWTQNEGNWYYSNDSGETKTGWVNDNGTWYYLDNSGAMKTGWVNDNGTWYYLSNSGAMKTGWVNDNGAWYNLNNSGAMNTGWINDNGKWYYSNNLGEMKTGWINDNGTWYFSDASGAMQTGVVQVDGKTYCLDATTGAMKVGDVTIEGKVYTFAQSGEAIGDSIPTSKAFNSAGVQLNGTNTSGKDTNASNTATANTAATSSSNSSSSSSSNNNNNNNKDINAGVSTNYLEDYREQYHFSVAKAWANDPNGMVYFNGEYHLFYQYYPDASVWGPMHWGHAVSTDLIHWTELPIALYPDEGGTIFSGSAVVDKDNTTGFFDGIAGGGLVAIYTQDYMDNGAERQKQSIAYSKDNGRTWIKYEGNPVIATDSDPLNNSAFRDPKVFYNEDAKEWMMVVAGGPLRFFSSTDLKTWKAEGMQNEIQTECPDIYKLEVGDTGTYKWVLSEGGRYYRVGDFKEVDGVWKFIPDNDEHLPMNFGKDSYAAQTYYGTGENGTPDGRRIMINWMNNWDYCNAIAPITKTFNGQFTLQNELKLAQTDEGIRLIQQPIEEYKTLRKEPITFDNVTISPDQPNIMSNLSGSKYEIVSEFTPDANTTEFGFKLRVGKDAGQETIVKYNIASGEVTLDRTKSGQAPGNFAQAYSSKVNKTADGKIQLHIFVDSSSVEVYGNNGEVCGSAQVFPNRSSQGIEVYSLGGKTKATIAYYPLSGIWNNELKGTKAVLVSLSEGEIGKTVGDEFSIYTATLPEAAEQGVIWKFSDAEVLEIVSQDNIKTTFKTVKAGSTTLTAISKDGNAEKTANLNVYGNDPSGIIKDLTSFSTNGTWYVKGNAYVGNDDGDAFAVSEQTNEIGMVSTLEADADVSDGNTAGLILLSQNANPKEGSVIANINKNGEYRVFEFTGLDGNGIPIVKDLIYGIVPKTDDNIYKLKSEVNGKHVKYWINDELVCDTNQDFETGRFGLNVFGGATSFTNVTLKNNVPNTQTSIPGSGLTFNNTPEDLHVSDDSYVVDKGKKENGFAISDQNIDTAQNTYTLDIDSKILGDWRNQIPASGDVAGVVLFAQSDDFFAGGGIIANVGKWGSWRMFARLPDGSEVELADGNVGETTYRTYKLKVKLVGNKISFWIDDKLVCDNIEQNYYTTGKFGLNVWNGPSEFRNITLKEDSVLEAGQTSTTTGAAVDIAAIAGVTAPVTGATPVLTIADTTEYTGTIAWSETPVIFAQNKVYTATITITPKAGYTLTDVIKDYFTVEGATATNAANSGVITAVFPTTK